MKDKLTTNADTEQVAPPDAKHLLCDRLFKSKVMIHELKLQQPFFNDVFYNKKEFEVRKNDRNFKVGDRLKLIEYPSNKPRFVLKDVKYILEGGQYGIEKGYVVLGLKEIPKAEPLSEIIAKEKSMVFTGRR